MSATKCVKEDPDAVMITTGQRPLGEPASGRRVVSRLESASSPMSRAEHLQELENTVCQLFARKSINYQDHADYGLVGALVEIEDAQMAIEDQVKISDFAADGDLYPTDCANIREALLDLHTFATIALMILDYRKNDVPLPLVKPTTTSQSTNIPTVELPPDGEDAALKEVALENARKQLSQAEDERRREKKSARKYNVDSEPILHVRKDKKKRWSHLKLWRV